MLISLSLFSKEKLCFIEKHINHSLSSLCSKIFQWLLFRSVKIRLLKISFEVLTACPRWLSDLALIRLPRAHSAPATLGCCSSTGRSRTYPIPSKTSPPSHLTVLVSFLFSFTTVVIVQNGNLVTCFLFFGSLNIFSTRM